MSGVSRVRVSALLCLAFLFLASPRSVLATSAQIEISEPVLVPGDGRVHGTAFFGIAAGSGVYDTAGNVGVTFPVGKAGEGWLYLFGDIFTWIENTEADEFEPKRVIYTIEPGYYFTQGRGLYRVFVKHQSFHDVDFADDLDESYELYGVSYRRLGPAQYYISVGNYANTHDVDYDWDIAASVTFDLQPIGGRTTYFEAWLHHITEGNSSEGRDGFTDYAGELGIRYLSGMVLFARYELLHDIDRFAGRSDHHVLVGVRYSR